MDFIPSIDTYEQDEASRAVWAAFYEKLKDRDGIAYYKHPILAAASPIPPDLALIASGYEPVVIRCLPWQIDEIESIAEDTWTVEGKEIDSPVLQVEDIAVGLKSKFDRERILRGKLDPIPVIAMPLITQHEFAERFGNPQEVEGMEDLFCIWKSLQPGKAIKELHTTLSERQWALAKSVFQGINPLNRNVTEIKENLSTMGGAIQALEKEIALLDQEQHKVAVQMAPGPQRIRGLAGTGKTVVLAMKAANIHLRYPKKKVLFTFHTQSLYNQAKSLISKFYRVHSDSDPDWDFVHVRHGWGSSSRPGVYYDLVRRHGIPALTLQSARNINYPEPFRACCQQALKAEIKPFYDFVLIDEAQDFPQEYFEILGRLVGRERQIYFAYDELQSLTSIEIPSPEDLFGKDSKGNPVISLAGEDYPGGIEKDFVLHKSYRCPRDILMLAHGIGLGIHGPHGCVQMLANRGSWESVGYEVTKGNLVAKDETEIYRPENNSPNKIANLYKGKNALIEVQEFATRTDEMTWIARSIRKEIKNEGVHPEHIVVIFFDSRRAKKVLLYLQNLLEELDVQSSIPGLVDVSWEFAEPDRVTLTTVYRAKGNEAPIVYLAGFEALNSYAEEIESRNRAFAALSRSKGWLRVSGVGKQMTTVKEEVVTLLQDMPYFRFLFPNMKDIRIRRLDASETTRRRKEVKKARQTINALLSVDKEALRDLDAEQLARLKKLVDEVGGEDK